MLRLIGLVWMRRHAGRDRTIENNREALCIRTLKKREIGSRCVTPCSSQLLNLSYYLNLLYRNFKVKFSNKYILKRHNN